MQRGNGSQPLPVRVFRVDELVTVAAPMPGLAPEDIRVEVTGKGHLILEGRAPTDPDQAFGHIKSEQKEVLIDEWSVGPYYRDVPLNTAVDGTAATVTYGNGVLVVALPVTRQKSRPAQMRLVPVGSGRGERLPR